MNEAAQGTLAERGEGATGGQTGLIARFAALMAQGGFSPVFAGFPSSALPRSSIPTCRNTTPALSSCRSARPRPVSTKMAMSAPSLCSSARPVASIPCPRRSPPLPGRHSWATGSSATTFFSAMQVERNEIFKILSLQAIVVWGLIVVVVKLILAAPPVTDLAHSGLPPGNTGFLRGKR